MTELKKAREIYDKMWVRIPARYTPINESIKQSEEKTSSRDMARRFSLVAVDVVLSTLSPYAGDNNAWTFWNNVRKEIELIK